MSNIAIDACTAVFETLGPDYLRAPKKSGLKFL